MKKIITFFLLIILIAGAWVYFSNQNVISQPNTQFTNNQPTTLPVQEKIISEPIRLEIPSLGVNAVVESVGMDEKGNMDVPKEDMNVAWYNLGYKPGVTGSAVIAGHFDRRNGGPAVFYKIGELRPGDTIKVISSNDETSTFEVTDSKSYEFDKVPLNEVFDSRDKQRLNLITCEGVFDKSSKNYSKRLVVYAELVE